MTATNRFSVPSGIDVSFANGGLTGPGGHPEGLARRNIGPKSWDASDGEGNVFHSIGSRTDLDAVWPRKRARLPATRSSTATD